MLPLDWLHLPQAGTRLRISVEGVDWSEVAPYWLVVKRDGKVQGALQVAPGKPVGRLEMLALDPGLDKKKRATLTKALVFQGLAVLKAAGAQLAMSVISRETPAWKRVLKRRGGVAAFSGRAIVLRL